MDMNINSSHETCCTANILYGHNNTPVSSDHKSRKAKPLKIFYDFYGNFSCSLSQCISTLYATTNKTLII